MWGWGCLRAFRELADSRLLQRMNRELLGLLQGDFEPCLSWAMKEQKRLLFLGCRPPASSLSAPQPEQRRCPRSLLAPLPSSGALGLVALSPATPTLQGAGWDQVLLGSDPTFPAAGVALPLDTCCPNKLRWRWAGGPASPPRAHSVCHGIPGPVPIQGEVVISDVPFVPGHWERWLELAVAACVLSTVRRGPGDQIWVAPKATAIL